MTFRKNGVSREILDFIAYLVVLMMLSGIFYPAPNVGRNENWYATTSH